MDGQDRQEEDPKSWKAPDYSDESAHCRTRNISLTNRIPKFKRLS